jgi:hypothetical protein
VLKAASDIRSFISEGWYSRYKTVANRPQSAADEPARLAIVNTANRPWAVIDSKTISERWQACPLQEFYFSPGGRAFDHSGLAIDDAVTVILESAELTRQLQVFAPTVIYLRVSPHTKSEFLIAVLRLAFPAAVLVVEFYDASCHFKLDALSYIFGGNQQAIAGALEGCAVGFHYADAVVVKMGGTGFHTWYGETKTPLLQFFPALEDAPLQRISHEQSSRRVLYAGSLSARELLGGIGSVDGANMVQYFDMFAGQTECTLEIVNAAHGTATEDKSEKFAALLQRYGPKSGQSAIHYRRAMPRQKLIEFACGFDIGICCAHYRDDKVMDVTRYGLPNRMMSYLAAGLPVIIDDRFEYAADLITKFGAGAVVRAGDFTGFRALLHSLDLGQASEGAEKLVQHMRDENVKILSSLLHVIKPQRPKNSD